MDIFINTERRNYIKLLVYYCNYKTNNNQENLLFFYKKEAANEAIQDKLKKVEVRLLLPTFEEYMDTVKKSVIQTANGEALVHESSYKQQIIKSFLKKVVTDDYEMDIDEENYGSIHPLLGDAIYKAFDEAFLNPIIKVDEVY